VAAIGGDGIGVEVVDERLKVLAARAQADTGFGHEVEYFNWNSARYLEHGHNLPSGDLDRFNCVCVTRKVTRRAETPRSC
jgi:tartrate dehydrogenase/decarboxylase/D-malate dehydrogenase